MNKPGLYRTLQMDPAYSSGLAQTVSDALAMDVAGKTIRKTET